MVVGPVFSGFVGHGWTVAFVARDAAMKLLSLAFVGSP
jgi:hypothetical protein